MSGDDAPAPGKGIQVCVGRPVLPGAITAGSHCAD